MKQKVRKAPILDVVKIEVLIDIGPAFSGNQSPQRNDFSGCDIAFKISAWRQFSSLPPSSAEITG